VRLILAGLLLLFAPFRTASASSAPPDTFTVELEKDDTRTAIKVAPRADGMVALTGTDGRVEFVSGARIRSIRDAAGNDRTSDVLIGRDTLTSAKKHPRKPMVYKPFRLRPGPPSACGSYLVTESSILGRVGSNEAGLGTGYVVMEYGYAKNVGRSFSVGGTGFLGITEEHSQAGFRLRLVKWLNKDTSFNLSPGIVAVSSQNDGLDESLGPQFTVQASLAAGGMFGLTLETYTVGRREYHNSYVDPPEDVHATFTSVGVRFGGWPGIITTPVAFFVGALMSIKE
jgi:hypothetical protein